MTAVQPTQLVEQVIERDNVRGCWASHEKCCIQRHLDVTSASFLCGTGSSVIHQDATHGSGCNRAKMCRVLPLDLTLIDQSQKGLMDQCGGLQAVIAPLAAQMAIGHLTQLAINLFGQLRRRCLGAAARLGQQLGGGFGHGFLDVTRFRVKS